MSKRGSVVHTPENGQTLAEYLQRFTEEETREIVVNPELITAFATILQECFRSLEERENSFENLWRTIRRVTDFDRLLSATQRLELVRHRLLELLAATEKEINRISTASIIRRLVVSSVDMVNAIGSIWMSPEYASLALAVTTILGLQDLASTTQEMRNLENSSNELLGLIRMDQEYFEPIREWYQQNPELEEAMREVLPFDVTSDIVADLAEMEINELTEAQMLATLLRSVAENDPNRLRDENMIRNLIIFTTNSISLDWVRWIIFRRHPIFLNFMRIILQLQSNSLRFTFNQSIPALAAGDQSITAFPVWGRIGLNAFSIFEVINSLRGSELSTISDEIRRIRRHLQSQLAALHRIIEFRQLRRASDAQRETS